MPIVAYAQFREDMILAQALPDVPNDQGFYIDIGAQDPEDISVTKLFYDRGWRGVNVEASPRWHRTLTEARPRDVNLNYAVSTRSGPITFYDHKDGGLGTTVESIIDDHASRGILAKDPITVETTTLTAICDEYARNWPIHFLKVDVEGAEGDVLESMDFNAYRPWLLCIEAHVPMRGGDSYEWDGYVIASGYRLAYTDHLNRYYVAEEERDRLKYFVTVPNYYLEAQEARRFASRIAELEARASDLEARASAAEAEIAKRVASERMIRIGPTRATREAWRRRAST